MVTPGPDPTGVSLRRGRAGALGVLFSESLTYAFADPGAVLFLRGLASVGERAGVALTRLPVPPGATGALAAVRNALVDGVIVYSLPEAHPAVQACVERRLPLVRVDMPAPPGEAADRIDDRAGARSVAEHVLGLGHRRIGVLADRMSADGVRGPADRVRRREASFPVARWRLDGYADALGVAAAARAAAARRPRNGPARHPHGPWLDRPATVIARGRRPATAARHAPARR